MHDRKLEDPMQHEVADLELDRFVVPPRVFKDARQCNHTRVDDGLWDVCMDCGDREPGWLVRRVQALEDEIAKLRESVQPENR